MNKDLLTKESSQQLALLKLCACIGVVYIHSYMVHFNYFTINSESLPLVYYVQTILSQYIARVAVNNVKNVNQARKAIKKAFENQINGKGFSLIEVVSACPTNWGMTPQKALEWVESDMLPYYPIGVYKDRSGP